MVKVTVKIRRQLFQQLQSLDGLGAKFQTICNWLEELSIHLKDDSSELEHVINNRRELLDIQAALCDAKDQVVCQFEQISEAKTSETIEIYLEPETCFTLCAWASVSRTFDGLLQSMHYALDTQSAVTLYPIEKLYADMQRALSDLHMHVRDGLWALCKEAMALISDTFWLAMSDRQQWKAKRIMERAVFFKRDTSATAADIVGRINKGEF